MGNLYLVRHGQASFGTDDYDVLSELGYRQSLRLGEYFRQKGLSFERTFSGTLQRQIKTLAGIGEGMHTSFEAERCPGLNEYDSDALVNAIHTEKLPVATTPEISRTHFKLLKQALAQWMSGAIAPVGMPSYQQFVAGIDEVLKKIRDNCKGNVLLVSSGGPISSAVGHVLGMSAQATIDLNMRIRNCSLTEFTFTPQRHTLLTFNTLPHLDSPEHEAMVSYY